MMGLLNRVLYTSGIMLKPFITKCKIAVIAYTICDKQGIQELVLNLLERSIFLKRLRIFP